jgi:hypothetical protein
MSSAVYGSFGTFCSNLEEVLIRLRILELTRSDGTNNISNWNADYSGAYRICRVPASDISKGSVGLLMGR